MTSLDPDGVQYGPTEAIETWVLFVKGQWRGWWQDPDTKAFVIHEFPELGMEVNAQQQERALKLLRKKMVDHYGIDRIHRGMEDAYGET